MSQIGEKHDENKLVLSLIPPKAIIGLGEVLTFGAQKYPFENWKHVPDAQRRYKDALLRHYYAYELGEKLDPESGLSHLKHMLSNIAFLVSLEE